MKLKHILLEELIRFICVYAMIFFCGLYILAPNTELGSKWLFLGSGIFSFVIFCVFVFLRLLTGKPLNATSPKHFQFLMIVALVIILSMFLIRTFSLATANYGGFVFSIIMTILGFIAAILLMKKNYDRTPK